jgi:hypothetical protein
LITPDSNFPAFKPPEVDDWLTGLCLGGTI